MISSLLMIVEVDSGYESCGEGDDGAFLCAEGDCGDELWSCAECTPEHADVHGDVVVFPIENLRLKRLHAGLMRVSIRIDFLLRTYVWLSTVW